jgi:ribonuclease HI
MTTIRVFTDGACEGNGRKEARASYACWFPEHKELSVAARVPEEDGQTNQRGEMLAIAESVKIVKSKFQFETVDLEIYTDSMYCKDCLTKWLVGWVKNDWKTAKGEPVKHRDLIEETTRTLAKFKSYKITHVSAHTGGDDDFSKNNEIVDKMAVKVLHPNEDVKVVLTDNKVSPLPGSPLQLMGPPVSEKLIIDWCKTNLDKLDSSALNAALMSALSKTVKKNGFEVVKQKLHKTNQYRLVSANHLIASNVTITKEE